MAIAIDSHRSGPPGQPDIAYTPNHDTYQARTRRRLENESLPKSVPEGFPEKVVSDLVWDGKTVSTHYEWSYELNDQERAEIDEALRSFQCESSISASLSQRPRLTAEALGKPLGNISQETFPLPSLHTTLRDISKEVHTGHGFKVVRGIPVSRYTREENVIIYAGIASHVANIRGRQDNMFNDQPADVVLAHIKDLTGHVDAHSIGAPAYTTEKQVFHTDVGDIIALFALESAAEGGESFLASSWTVYNELAATRPDLIHTLAGTWDFDE